jgi:hypothetical protein
MNLDAGNSLKYSRGKETRYGAFILLNPVAESHEVLGMMSMSWQSCMHYFKYEG